MELGAGRGMALRSLKELRLRFPDNSRKKLNNPEVWAYGNVIKGKTR